jgi:hypothetical protein
MPKLILFTLVIDYHFEGRSGKDGVKYENEPWNLDR